jgi:hypothetical protein
MSDYADIADLSWENIQEPHPVPNGTYLLKLKNAVFQPSKEEGKSPVVMFVHAPKEAMADVNADELAALGAEYDISENKVFTRIYIEDGSSWAQVRNILSKHGLKPSGSVEESLKKAKGAEVLGYLVTDRFERKDKTIGENNKVTEWAPVDE